MCGYFLQRPKPQFFQIKATESPQFPSDSVMPELREGYYKCSGKWYSHLAVREGVVTLETAIRRPKVQQPVQ